MTANEMLNSYAPMIEAGLKEALPSKRCLQKNVVEAMEYALLGGGKRIRPALVLEFYRQCGGNIYDALPFACAVEMIHTYSLIHDDLPCMDNDDMRRGRPSCHIAFSEEIALLAGDALLSLAFETAAKTCHDHMEPEQILKAIEALGRASGAKGMVGGQVIDLQYEDKVVTLDILQKMHEGKTAAMIRVCGEIGCLLAGGKPEQLRAALGYCGCIGLTFQIVDDILDATSTSEILGKPAGSDAVNGKNTYYTLLGPEKCQNAIRQLTEQARQEASAFLDSETLCLFAEYLAERTA